MSKGEKKEGKKPTKEQKIWVSVILILLALIIFANLTDTNQEQGVADENVEEALTGILGSNGVFENESPSMANAYSDWSYLEVISGVYGGIGNCSVKIGNGDDGKYVVTLTGTGRDNPYTDYNKTIAATVMSEEAKNDWGEERLITLGNWSIQPCITSIGRPFAIKKPSTIPRVTPTP